MSGIWVYKADGSIQCYPDMEKTYTLEEMRADLASLIGNHNITDQEKRQIPGPRIERCGIPTGSVNAYRITIKGMMILLTGIRGMDGWAFWKEASITSEDFRVYLAADDRFTPWPWGSPDNKDMAEINGPVIVWPSGQQFSDAEDDREEDISDVLEAMKLRPDAPKLITELVGMKIRILRPGDMMTMDWMPSRVNIVIDDKMTIERVFFG